MINDRLTDSFKNMLTTTGFVNSGRLRDSIIIYIDIIPFNTDYKLIINVTGVDYLNYIVENNDLITYWTNELSFVDIISKVIEENMIDLNNKM